MLERFFEKEARGALKGMTLEWECPHCAGKNFRILAVNERGPPGDYHALCRYCRTRCRVIFEPRQAPVPGEEAFMERLSDEELPAEEQQELVRDFAEIAYLRAERANPRGVAGKERLLEEKITFFRRRRRL